MSWMLGAQLGTKFSKLFAIEKQAQRVKLTTESVVDDDEEVIDDNPSGGGGLPSDGGDG